MNSNNTGGVLMRGFGYQEVSWARFAPKGSTGAETLTDSCGIASITNTAAGTWTVVLSDISQVGGFVVLPSFTDNGELLHEVKAFTKDVTAGSFVLKHRTAANDAATPLADSDVVDEIDVVVVTLKKY